MQYGRKTILTVLLAGGLAAGPTLLQFGCSGGSPEHSDSPAKGRLDRNSPVAQQREARYGVEIRTARRLGMLDQTFETPSGSRTAGVPCSTCHATMVEGPTRERPGELTDFHTDMQFDHGELTCGSCHDRENRDHLTLADGRTIPFSRTMKLCGQCHGPQMRDYEHGAHGGMSGYWDLSRGPRVRNNCVNCHDPHSPAYPKLQPAPPPRDRGLEQHTDPSTHSSKPTPGDQTHE